MTSELSEVLASPSLASSSTNSERAGARRKGADAAFGVSAGVHFRPALGAALDTTLAGVFELVGSCSLRGVGTGCFALAPLANGMAPRASLFSSRCGSANGAAPDCPLYAGRGLGFALGAAGTLVDALADAVDGPGAVVTVCAGAGATVCAGAGVPAVASADGAALG